MQNVPLIWSVQICNFGATLSPLHCTLYVHLCFSTWYNIGTFVETTDCLNRAKKSSTLMSSWLKMGITIYTTF